VIEDWNLETQTPVLKANTKSWRPPVTFDTIEIRLVKDAATQIQALLTGEVDIGYNFGVIELDQLRESGFNITTRPGGQVTSIALSNLREGSPFQDQRVRQAINYAVDKRAISDIIMLGTTAPAGQPGVPGMTGYNPKVKPYPYDPAKSRELLAAAGYADGFAFRADVLIAGGVVEAVTMYQKIAQDLAAVGIRFEPHPVQGAQWIAKYFSGDWGEADAISATWNGASYWDVIRAIEIFSCNKPAPFFCVPEVMPRIDATHGMFDPVERERALQALSEETHDLAPSLFLVPLVDVIAAHERLGPLLYRHKQLAMEKLTLAEMPARGD
jgi:peptide/nickel transport system substrate-binding protein